MSHTHFSPPSLMLIYAAALLLAATGVSTCTVEERPPRILVFSKTAGYRHACIPAGVAAFRRLCQENGMLMDSTEDAGDFNEKNLCRYAAVVFLNTTGDVLDPDQEVAFERYIQAGGGFVGIHSASDTEYGWSWYGNLVGAYFVSHPEQQDAVLQVKEHDHPATKHLGDTWRRFDEWYNLRHVNPNVNVLLNLDENSYQGGTMGDRHPMSWYHEYDGGRAFYTALGHTDESYSEPAFLQHILGGLNYAVGNNRRLNYELCRTPEPADPTRFVKTVLATDLNEPMELDLLPDGKIIFIERRGAIKLFDPGTGLTNIAYKLPVHDAHEDGLMGLALDPNYPVNHWIYLYYSPVGNEPVNYLSRFVFTGDTLDRASEKIMLKVPVQRDECCHAAGCLEFDANGYLYLATGDNTNPFASDGYAPVDERPGRSAWDAQRSSANTSDLRGKILRIKPLPDGTYTCPEGNLFVPPPAAAMGGAPEIYIMGCRNPFRLSLDSRRGLLFWGEVGPDAGEPDSLRGPSGYDEVNRARQAGFYGWPYFVGNNKPYRDFDFQKKLYRTPFDPSRPVNDSPNNSGARELPPAQSAMIWYPYGNSPDFPLVGNGGRNAMAGPVYYCDQYPADTRLPDHFDGKLIIYDWMRGWMMAVTLDSLGNFSRMEPFAGRLSFSRPTDMIVDKNGAIWVLEYGKQWFSSNPDARLSRIDYIRGNRPPVAELLADKTAGAAPCTVRLSAALSRDFDGDRLQYSFNFGDGSPKLTVQDRFFNLVWAGLGSRKKTAKSHPADSIVHTYLHPGTYRVTLEVSDPNGAKTTVTQKITVGNDPPRVYWDLHGHNRSFYVPGETLRYQLCVEDTEDGSLKTGTISPEAVAASIDYLETGFDIAQIALGHQAAQQQSEYTRGKLLIDRSDCAACHAVERQVNGPSYTAIAERYRKNEFAVRDLSLKVIKGGAGNWGQTVMSAHPDLSEADAGEMIRWILSLGAPPRPKQPLPPQGTFTLQVPEDKTKKTHPGTFIFQGSYRDRGTAAQAPLSAGESLALRPAFQQAEHADSISREIRQYRPTEDQVVLQELQHNSFFMFKHVDLRGIYSVAIGIGSGDKNYDATGGRIELRLDSPAGPIAGSVSVPKYNADTMVVREITLPVDQRFWPLPGVFHDLYFVAKKEENPSRRIAPVDWVRFNL